MSRIAPNYKVLTAQEAVNMAPHLWTMPITEPFKLLRPGHMVQIVIDSVEHHKAEAIWVAIVTRKGAKFRGTVWDNPAPRRTIYHGVAPKDYIDFTVKHILNIAFEVPTVKPGVRII